MFAFKPLTIYIKSQTNVEMNNKKIQNNNND